MMHSVRTSCRCHTDHYSRHLLTLNSLHDNDSHSFSLGSAFFTFMTEVSALPSPPCPTPLPLSPCPTPLLSSPLAPPLSPLPPTPHLPQPFLLDGFKCDLRIYVLVTSCNPLRIFVYKDGLVRDPYTLPGAPGLHVVYVYVCVCMCADTTLGVVFVVQVRLSTQQYTPPTDSNLVGNNPFTLPRLI